MQNRPIKGKIYWFSVLFRNDDYQLLSLSFLGILRLEIVIKYFFCFLITSIISYYYVKFTTTHSSYFIKDTCYAETPRTDKWTNYLSNNRHERHTGNSGLATIQQLSHTNLNHIDTVWLNSFSIKFQKCAKILIYIDERLLNIKNSMINWLWIYIQ